MERKGSRRKNEQSLQISFGDFNLTITPAERPAGLVPARQTQTEKPVRITPEPSKRLDITAQDISILMVMAQGIFTEETRGMGEAEHSIEQELRVKSKPKKEKIVDEEDFTRVILGIKSRSRRIGPKDIAEVVIKTVPQMRDLNRNDSTYIGVMARLSSAIKEYWTPTEKSKTSSKRR